MAKKRNPASIIDAGRVSTQAINLGFGARQQWLRLRAPPRAGAAQERRRPPDFSNTCPNRSSRSAQYCLLRVAAP